MSGGNWCLVRSLGLVKGGKGLRHHEVLIDFSTKPMLGALMGPMLSGWQTLAATLSQRAPSSRRVGTTNADGVSSTA